jgi:hypothetical protein
VLLLQGQCEAIDDRSQDLEKLRNSIESFRLVNKLEKDIVDRASNIRAKIKEFTVDSVKSCLEEVSFPRIFRVKELKKLA